MCPSSAFAFTNHVAEDRTALLRKETYLFGSVMRTQLYPLTHSLAAFKGMLDSASISQTRTVDLAVSVTIVAKPTMCTSNSLPPLT